MSESTLENYDNALCKDMLCKDICTFERSLGARQGQARDMCIPLRIDAFAEYIQVSSSPVAQRQTVRFHCRIASATGGSFAAFERSTPYIWSSETCKEGQLDLFGLRKLHTADIPMTMLYPNPGISSRRIIPSRVSLHIIKSLLERFCIPP